MWRYSRNKTNETIYISYQYILYLKKIQLDNRSVQYSNPRISSENKSPKVSGIKHAGTEPYNTVISEVGVPLVYTSSIHTASTGEYLHFRYLKCLVNKPAAIRNWVGPPVTGFTFVRIFMVPSNHTLSVKLITKQKGRHPIIQQNDSQMCLN